MHVLKSLIDCRPYLDKILYFLSLFFAILLYLYHFCCFCTFIISKKKSHTYTHLDKDILHCDNC